MSKRHCCKHPARNRSHYPERLAARGFSRAPRMEPLDLLRRRQLARTDAGLPPWRVHAAEVAEP
jgi:hypothetical protein